MVNLICILLSVQGVLAHFLVLKINFFGEKSTRRFDSTKVEVEYIISALSRIPLCTIVRTNRSNSNHIVTKDELPRGKPKLYGYSILIPFSIDTAKRVGEFEGKKLFTSNQNKEIT